MSMLALGPELTIARVATAREALLQALRGWDLVLNLCGVIDFDSAGVQLLLATRRSLEAQGRIGYVNDDFVEASGFTIDELMGQPNNILRHPDMPADAFEDRWRTLQLGAPAPRLNPLPGLHPGVRSALAAALVLAGAGAASTGRAAAAPRSRSGAAG